MKDKKPGSHNLETCQCCFCVGIRLREVAKKRFKNPPLGIKSTAEKVAQVIVKGLILARDKRNAKN